MKKSGLLLLGMFTVLPVMAQETAASDAAPASDSSAAAEAAPAPADAAPADSSTPPADAAAPAADAAPADTAAAPATDAAPPADASTASTTESAPAADASAATSDSSSAAAATESAPAETAPTETAAAEAAPTESAPERKPWKLYVGYDYVHMNFQITEANPPQQSPLVAKFGRDFLTSEFHQARGGVRLFDVIGLEAHFGYNADKNIMRDPSKVKVKNYGGLYLAPTGTLLNTVEVAALVGYSYMQLARPGVDLTVKGIGYGVNMELPIRKFSESLPDIRVGGGVMMYHRDSESRNYGAHFGLRYDFQV